MKSSFSKSVKRHSKKEWPFNVYAKFDYYVLEKSFSHVNKCIHMYIFMKSYFPEHDLRTLLLQPRYLDWHLTCFGKELII